MRGFRGMLASGILLFSATVMPNTFAAVIDFENLTGPSTFSGAGNAQTLNVSTGIGTVVFTGGVILRNTTQLPADSTSIYGTESGLLPGHGSGFSNPITITFPQAITNFFVDVINGNTIPVTFEVADNQGHTAQFTVAPNTSSGVQTIGFPASGTVVTVTALPGTTSSPGTQSIGGAVPAGSDGRSAPASSARALRPNATGATTWDFFIDNIHFNEALPPGLGGPTGPSAVPVPPSVLLLLSGLGVAGLYKARRFISRG